MGWVAVTTSVTRAHLAFTASYLTVSLGFPQRSGKLSQQIQEPLWKLHRKVQRHFECRYKQA